MASKDKKMKTAFIRISADNETKEGNIHYELKGLEAQMKDWCSSCKMTYYMIEHNGEPGDANRHFHIVINFGSNPTQFSTIKNRFPYGNIQNARSIKNCVQYLVHLNDLSKRAYEWNDVITNDPNIDRFKVLSHQALDLRTKQYIDRIMTGEIREYNFANTIDPEVYAKRKTQLLNALELYRQKVGQDKSRHITVIVCEGGTGTGKTTWVKNICEKQGKSLCLSSSSNDPWQDYKGEDVMLLDELRSDVFGLADLLKILDNHTKSTSRSRYSNKMFLGDYIFITTNEEFQDWYKDSDDASRYALFRRGKTLMKFRPSGEPFKSYVDIFEWNEDQMKYLPKGSNVFSFANLIDKDKPQGMDMSVLFG